MDRDGLQTCTLLQRADALQQAFAHHPFASRSKRTIRSVCLLGFVTPMHGDSAQHN